MQKRIFTFIAVLCMCIAARPSANAEETTLELSKDTLKGINIDRAKAIRINIPGLINFNIDLSDEDQADCEDLYKTMVKSPTAGATKAYHDACIDKDTETTAQKKAFVQ